MRLHHIFLTLVFSSLANSSLAVEKTVVRQGYRLSEVEQPQKWDWKGEAKPRFAACQGHPAVPAGRSGNVSVVNLVKDRYFIKFFEGGGKLPRLITQQKNVPRAIVIESGIWRLPQLQMALAADSGALLRQGNAYTLRLPLLIRGGAGLVIENGQVLHLGRERGAFIINTGSLHVNNASVQAWDEQSGRASEADRSTVFKPFVLGWSGSITVLEKATIKGLGFAEGLSHGLTFAVGPKGMAGMTLPAPATVFISNSQLDGLYNAVHASAIPNVRVCNSQINNSRMSSIDLDEGSSGVFVGNRIEKNKGAHSIYFSKGVRNTWLLGNSITQSMGTGLAISGSGGVVVADNDFSENKDAITLSESENIRLADNKISANRRHGISLRDARNIVFQDGYIGGNKGVGILAQVSAPAKPGSSVRMLGVIGVQLADNHSSAIVIDPSYGLTLSQAEFLYPGRKRRSVFRGLLNQFEADILRRLPREGSLQLVPVTGSKLLTKGKI